MASRTSARIDYLRARHEEAIVALTGEEEAFARLLEFDPTAKKTNLQRIVQWLLAGAVRLEDVEDVHLTLERFERMKPYIPAERRNVYSYASPGDIEIMLDGEAPIVVRAVPDEIRDQSPIVASGEDWVIVRLDTPMAAAWWGDSTRWCTRHRKNFDSYVRLSPIYVLESHGHKIQAHAALDQVMDRYDRDVDAKTLSAFPPEAHHALQRILVSDRKRLADSNTFSSVFTRRRRNCNGLTLHLVRPIVGQDAKAEDIVDMTHASSGGGIVVSHLQQYDFYDLPADAEPSEFRRRTPDLSLHWSDIGAAPEPAREAMVGAFAVLGGWHRMPTWRRSKDHPAFHIGSVTTTDRFERHAVLDLNNRVVAQIVADEPSFDANGSHGDIAIQDYGDLNAGGTDQIRCSTFRTPQDLASADPRQRLLIDLLSVDPEWPKPSMLIHFGPEVVSKSKIAGWRSSSYRSQVLLLEIAVEVERHGLQPNQAVMILGRIIDAMAPGVDEASRLACCCLPGLPLDYSLWKAFEPRVWPTVMVFARTTADNEAPRDEAYRQVAIDSILTTGMSSLLKHLPDHLVRSTDVDMLIDDGHGAVIAMIPDEMVTADRFAQAGLCTFDQPMDQCLRRRSDHSNIFELASRAGPRFSHLVMSIEQAHRMAHDEKPNASKDTSFRSFLWDSPIENTFEFTRHFGVWLGDQQDLGQWSLDVVTPQMLAEISSWQSKNQAPMKQAAGNMLIEYLNWLPDEVLIEALQGIAILEVPLREVVGRLGRIAYALSNKIDHIDLLSKIWKQLLRGHLVGDPSKDGRTILLTALDALNLRDIHKETGAVPADRLPGYWKELGARIVADSQDLPMDHFRSTLHLQELGQP